MISRILKVNQEFLKERVWSRQSNQLSDNVNATINLDFEICIDIVNYKVLMMAKVGIP